VIDLHAGGQVARLRAVHEFPYVADSKQQRQMQDVARGFGVPFVMIYQDKTPGLLTSTPERMGKISVGGEFGWGEGVSRAGVSMCRQGVVTAAIAHGPTPRRRFPRTPTRRRTQQRLIDNDQRDCYLTAPRDAYFEPAVELGTNRSRRASASPGCTTSTIRASRPRRSSPRTTASSARSPWGAKVVQGQSVAVVSRLKEWFT
jgi:predicted deacylase